MKTRHLAFVTITAAAALLAAVPLRAAVSVTTAAPPKEMPVSFRTAEGKFVTATSNGTLGVAGDKIGSKQKFTIIDLHGGTFEDGAEVKIRYTPHTGGTEPPKSSYWGEVEVGIKRNSSGDTFKIKKVGDKYAFLTLGGKFVGGPVKEGALGLSDKQEGAMLVQFVDLSTGVPKFPKKSADSATTDALAADTSTTNKPAADKPASDKPATE